MDSQINLKTALFTLLEFLRRNALGIGVSLAVIFLLQRLFAWIVDRYVGGERKRHELKKWSKYFAVAAAAGWLILLYYSYSKEDTPFLFFLVGLLLAGVAISLRDVFSNFVGWLIIMSNKGFREGDRIRIGTVHGDVIDIGLLRTLLSEIGDWVEADQSTGRLVTIPNSDILSNAVYNYTQGYDFIWSEMKVLVTFESDWRRAEQIVLEAAFKDYDSKKDQIQERLRRVRRKYLLRYNYASPKTYITIADSGVRITVRFLVRARRRRLLEDELAREILLRFAEEAGIELAYPTVRLFRRGGEASAGTGDV